MKRSKFSLSHYKLLTADMGKIVPLTWYEALPGDSFQASTSLLIRCSPLQSPVMHPVRVRLHNFFVPNRLLWEDWENFITGGPDGKNASSPPVVEFTDVAEGSLADYLGIPAADYSGSPSGNLTVSALPFRAMQIIYNEWYRDQQLIEEVPIAMTGGIDSTVNLELYNASWEKDYFTTTRPEPQLGDEVLIPLGDSAPVVPSGSGMPTYSYNGSTGGKHVSDSSDSRVHNQPTPGAVYDELWDDPNLEADLSLATGISVNDLRFALAIQRYQEARNNYGSRYDDYLRYLGVSPQDSRLQNPEFISGGSNMIQFSEVLRTGNSADHQAEDNPIGEMLGHGIAAVRSNRFRRYIPEHGIIMQLMSVIPKSIYTTELERKWTRSDKEDYWQKELMYLGDQEVKNLEIQSTHTQPDETFGYQSRYNEYRGMPSSIAGEFRSTLNYWHYAREFAGDVALNQSFIESVPTKRVNSSQDTNVLYIMANHSIQARRMLTRVAKPRTF